MFRRERGKAVRSTELENRGKKSGVIFFTVYVNGDGIVPRTFWFARIRISSGGFREAFVAISWWE
jgi:hypothetical protein